MQDPQTTQAITTMVQFLDKYISTLYASLILFVGGILVYLREAKLKKRDFELKYRDKIVDKRIKAHEILNSLAKDLQMMVALDGMHKATEDNRTPRMMVSVEAYNKWQVLFHAIEIEHALWFSSDIKQEMEFLRNYFFNLSRIMDVILIDKDKNSQDTKCAMIGKRLRQEFLDFGGSLNVLIARFFDEGFKEIKITYNIDMNQVEERLRSSYLHVHFKELMAIAKG